MRLDFQKSLAYWYKKSARSLPWRKTRDPYKIWISEVMLQQTTVNTVIPYYERWVRDYPSIEKVASAPLGRLLKNWQGLGYYQRAKNIHKAAGFFLREHKGRIPQDPDLLRNIPGFGPYTTHAVLSIAFDKPLALVDANVRRVAMRLLALEREANAREDAGILVFLKDLVPRRGAGLFNQALMELGALVCRPAEPLCFSCPVKNFCRVYKLGLAHKIPLLKKKRIERIEAVCAILRKKNKYFLQKRPSQGLLADLWEFPGGKIRQGESEKAALTRELKEELDVSLVSAEPFMVVRHSYTKFRVTLHVYQASVDPQPTADGRHRWVPFGRLRVYPVPSANAKIIRHLIQKG
jgi:A/G-specific adenine glycosylase